VTVLSVGVSIDHASVTLPELSPTVIATVDVLLIPPPVRQRTDVSDSHSVDSHAVSPARAFSVYVVRPRLLPCTVTLTDPVPARFAPVTVLSVGVSIDHASVTVP
jgi:hypothetical protein